MSLCLQVQIWSTKYTCKSRNGSARYYVGDSDNLDDFANHWVWEIQDIGASFTLFTGTLTGLLLDPPDTKPVDFFNLLFEDQMYKLIACETNR